MEEKKGFKKREEMNEERNKYLTEAMGGCWHEFSRASVDSVGICRKCKILEWHPDYSIPQAGEINDFSTWEGFGKLWEFAIGQKWWNRFLEPLNDVYIGNKHPYWLPPIYIGNKHPYWLPPKYINPSRFAEAIYKFLKEEKDEG